MQRSSTDKRHFIIAGALIVVVSIVLYALLYVALPLPLVASTQAVTIDWVFQAHMILLSVLFALVVVFMLYAVVVFRRRDGDTGDGEHFEGNTPLEIAWTVIPLIAVVIFGYIGVTSLRTVTAAQDNEVVVDVESFQWAWAFTYPDTGAASADLVLPVNQPARMELTSRDVIHSFWVPEFRVKQDAVPGQTTTLRFTPTVEGEYTLVCAELCGLTHYNMVAKVKVVSAAEYAQWQQVQLAALGKPPLADAGGTVEVAQSDAPAVNN